MAIFPSLMCVQLCFSFKFGLFDALNMGNDIMGVLVINGAAHDWVR